VQGIKHLHGKGLSINTVNRGCGMVRQFFRAAVHRELVAGNPFEGLQNCAKGKGRRQTLAEAASEHAKQPTG